MRLFADYHTHTVYSDGKGLVEDNARVAAAKALAEVAITDHGPANLFGVGVRSADIFLRIRDDIASAQEKHPSVRVLLGVEANVISGRGDLDVPDGILDRMDIVMVGLHPLVLPLDLFNGIIRLGASFLASYSSLAYQRAREMNTKALIAAVMRNSIDIVTHPGMHMPVDTRQLARACAGVNTCLEVNTSHSLVTPGFIRICSEEGACFAVGSDAHTPDRVGDLDRGRFLLEDCGVRPEQVLNACRSSGDSSMEVPCGAGERRD